MYFRISNYTIALAVKHSRKEKAAWERNSPRLFKRARTRARSQSGMLSWDTAARSFRPCIEITKVQRNTLHFMRGISFRGNAACFPCTQEEQTVGSTQKFFSYLEGIVAKIVANLLSLTDRNQIRRGCDPYKSERPGLVIPRHWLVLTDWPIGNRYGQENGLPRERFVLELESRRCLRN